MQSCKRAAFAAADLSWVDKSVAALFLSAWFAMTAKFNRAG